MTTKTDPKSSPDFLAAPKKGKGVRRLNRLPLAIVGGLVLLAVAGVSYTMLQRQASMQSASTAAPPEAPPVREAAIAPVRPTGPDYVNSPTPPADEPADPIPLLGDPMPAAGGANIAQERSQELDQRLRIIARVEENRLMAQEAALGAEPNVQTFRDRPGSTASTNGSAPGSIGGVPGRPGSTGPAGGLGDAAMAGLLGAGRDPDPNRQDDKRAFLSDVQPLDTYLPHTRVPALAATEVKAGTVIPGVMIGGINSDLPGQIIGQVRQNVYDTATGNHLLIPAGARLIGSYDSRVTMGQRRVLVAWNRVIFPDGSSVALDTMPGADVSGFAGFNDKVNNHYWRIFGNAFMLSLFSAGIQLSQPDPGPNAGMYDSQQILAAEIGRQLGQLGMEMSRRNLDIQPTLEIRPGYLFNVMVTKDMILPPWQGHPMAAGQ